MILRVGKLTLMRLAGMMWLVVAFILCRLAIIWYHEYQGKSEALFIVGGIVAGLLIQHLGFLKIVNKNLARINQVNSKYCLFGFMTWKSYVLVALMMTMGIIMRNSSIPHIYLSVIYMGIGLALGLSSIRYFRISLKKKPR